MKRRLFVAAWLFALSAAASIPALGLIRGVIFVGPGGYVAHTRLTHPLISVGAPVTLSHGSTSMVISIGAPVYAGGLLKDDVVAVAAPIYLRSSTRVTRDILAVGESTYKAAGVRVVGRIGGDMVAWDGRSYPGSINWLVATWQYSGLGFAAGLALLLVCVCVGVAFPWQTVLVANNLGRELLRSFIAGLMGLFLLAFLIVPLGLSLFGLPFALLIALAGGGAWLLGVTAAAVVIGKRIASYRRHDAGLLWAVVSGMFTLAIAGAVPWVGVIALGLAGTTGAGSLALTMVARSKPGPDDVSDGLEERVGTFSVPDAYITSGGASSIHGRQE